MVARGGGDGNRHLRAGNKLGTGGKRGTGDTQGQRTLLGIGDDVDRVRDLLVPHLYRDRIVRHGEGVDVIAAGERRNLHRSGGHIRTVDLRAVGNHPVVGVGFDGNRHLRAGNKLVTGGKGDSVGS